MVSHSGLVRHCSQLYDISVTASRSDFGTQGWVLPAAYYRVDTLGNRVAYKKSDSANRYIVVYCAKLPTDSTT